MSNLPAGTILFENVSKRYRLGALGTLRSTVAALSPRRREEDAARDLWALKDVSFRVEPGQSLGLIGPNGAGKTTTLKLLSNITRPTGGRIEVGGRMSSLIELGAGFHPELSGRDNIFLNGAILGLSRREIQRKLDEIVAFSELERFIDTPVKRYSSGMYVRLGFAVAAHVEPEVLLVDEVLAVGDASFRHRCMVRMEALREGGTTILFVSHNMHMVRKMCTQAILLKAGQLCAQGPTSDVITEYDKSLVSSADLPSPSDQLSADVQAEGDIRLTIITVTPTEDLAVASSVPIPSDASATLRIRYQSTRPQSIGRVDVRIIRDDGTLCSAIDNQSPTSWEEPHLDHIDLEGEIEIELDPIQLTTGRYFVLVQVTDPTDAAVVASGQSDYFTVFTRHTTPHPGVFIPRSRWSHISLT